MSSIFNTGFCKNYSGCSDRRCFFEFSLSLSNSNLLQTPYQKHLCRQFSIAYDLYLMIRSTVDSRVKHALGRDGPNWELLHNCPACFNELEEDQPMKYSVLWSTDGNDSLKRLDRRERSTEQGTLGASIESIDTRRVRGDFYIPRVDVDRWATTRLPPGAREACRMITQYFHLTSLH